MGLSESVYVSMLVLPSLIVVPPTVTANSVTTSEVEPPLVQHRLVHADIVAKRGLEGAFDVERYDLLTRLWTEYSRQFVTL